MFVLISLHARLRVAEVAEPPLPAGFWSCAMLRRSASMRLSCSVYDVSRVQNRVGPIVCRNLGRSCKIRITQLAREGLRRRACAYSGEVVTEFQSDSARTDSAVRILNAQPASAASRG